jgi:hypothetical protein
LVNSGTGWLWKVSEDNDNMLTGMLDSLLNVNRLPILAFQQQV